MKDYSKSFIKHVENFPKNFVSQMLFTAFLEKASYALQHRVVVDSLFYRTTRFSV